MSLRLTADEKDDCERSAWGVAQISARSPVLESWSMSLWRRRVAIA